MKQRGIRKGSWIGVAILLGACGQELQLPQTGEPPMPAATGQVPADGITGAAGLAGDVDPPRLPLPTEPAFTSFGGEGGVGTDTPHEASGGSSGSKAAGGANATGGTKSTGGSGSAAAGRNAGGVAGTAAAADAGSGGSEGGTETNPPEAGASQLYFSEYVEGTGSLKALEIYAPAPASLEGCELQTYFNGKTEPTRLALHGELAAGAVHVLCSSTLATAQPALCSRSTSLTFNGDDALALSCDGVVLDVIGEVGVDPGESWAEGATADHTLRRRCTVTHGRTAAVPFDVDAEWITFGTDTFSDLGQRACVAP